MNVMNAFFWGLVSPLLLILVLRMLAIHMGHNNNIAEFYTTYFCPN